MLLIKGAATLMEFYDRRGSRRGRREERLKLGSEVKLKKILQPQKISCNESGWK